MIKIILNNENLDIESKTVITIKKSQNLNGIQNQFSFSNNFNLPPTSKNLRLLRSNYLPSSKVKNMTVGYDVDIVINDCIYLRAQKMKVQKETQKGIPIYIVFSDNNFMQKAKKFLLNDINLGQTYLKSQFDFLNLNNSTDILRTAPITAQNSSGIVVLEEVPVLVNLVKLLEKLVVGLDYSFYGSLFLNDKLKKYYVNANYSEYGIGGVKFEKTKTIYDFLIDTLKTFNAYVDVSDSGRSVGIFLWNEIETTKKQFLDYSESYIDFEEYTSENGLSKKNTIEYSGSEPFYNSFFENNKSIVENSNYLKSNFGAGAMRLFDDQDLNDNGTLPVRVIGDKSEKTEINLYKFEETITNNVYYVLGQNNISPMYRAYTPNIQEIFNDFHFQYIKNISLPIIANLKFRYDAIFLQNLKLQNVFFVKQLSTYFLPLELNYSTKKDEIKLKSLMIENTRADVPIVFDLNISYGFLGQYIIGDASPLYSSQNISPQSIFTIVSFDFTKNKIFVTGNNNIRTQILATPVNIDIGTNFKLEFENASLINEISSSDLLFQFVSQEGGISRIAKINMQHNGIAKYVSEFKASNLPFILPINQIPFYQIWFNYAAKINTIANIPNTFAPQISNVGNINSAFVNYPMIKMQRSGFINIFLSVNAIYNVSTNGVLGKIEVAYDVYKNSIYVQTINLKSATVQNQQSATIIDIEEKNYNTFGNVGDEFTIIARLLTTAVTGQVAGSMRINKYNLKFTMSENL